MSALPKYSWDQAAILGLATANGFAALGIRPDTIRLWVHRGAFNAVGKAPRGAHLYRIDEVARHADRNTTAAIES